ncbi:MAG: response regulator [Myxococcales bacterium]|nr:response regulator [Myxococcales bacterium]
MPMPASPSHSKPQALRILVVDDDRAIHEDIRRVLAPPRRAGHDLAALEALLFNGDTTASPEDDGLPTCELLYAFQGEDAVDLLQAELEHGRPLDLAIVDMRMPPGWDGLRTVQEMWTVDPSLPVAFCTAYSDHTIEEVAARLHRTHVPWLSKPFHSDQLKNIVRRHARGLHPVS